MRKLDVARIISETDKPGCNLEEVQDANRLREELEQAADREKRAQGPQRVVSDLTRGRTRIG